MNNTIDELAAEASAAASIEEENIVPVLPQEPEYTVDDGEYNDLSMYFNKDDTGFLDWYDDADEDAGEVLDAPAEAFYAAPAAEDVPSDDAAVCETGAAEDGTVSEDVPAPVTDVIPDTVTEEASEGQEYAENASGETVTEDTVPEETVSEDTEPQVQDEADSAGTESADDVRAAGPVPEDDAASEDEAPEKKAASGRGKKWLLIPLIVLLAGLLAFAGIKLFGRKAPEANVLIHEGEICNAGGIEVTIDRVCVIGSLLTYQLDPDYTYVAVQYTFRNTGNQELSWESTPYMMLRPFVEGEEGYVPVEAESPEAEKLLSVYGSIPGTAPVSGDEQDPLSCLYGSFDYAALQIYSLDCGIDYSTVKEPLKSGESRESADVFKIRNELFDTGMYYICADNQNAVVYIDPTPLDVDVADPETDDVTDAADAADAE